MTSDFKRAVDTGDVLGAVLSVEMAKKEGKVLENILGQSPITYAMSKGDSATVSALIDAGINLEQTGKYEIYPLHYAVGKGKIEMVELLLDAGLYVGISDHRNGMTALHHAVESECLDMVKFILGKCKDPDVKNVSEWSPLHFAVHGKDSLIVQELLSAGANINAKDKHDMTPLHHASNKENGSAMIKYLVQSSADINYVSLGKWSPLHLAVQARHIDNSRTLLELGAEVNILGHKGRTPLGEAKKNQHPAMIQLLEAYGGSTDV